MSYRFSQVSLNRLASCHPHLQSIMQRAILIMDFTVVCGHRSPEAQAEAFRVGNSTKKPGQSLHNRFPSMAVDIAPYYPVDKIRWEDHEAFCLLAGIVKGLAHMHGVKIRWGGDWDGDSDRKDQKGLDDLGHFEIIG